MPKNNLTPEQRRALSSKGGKAAHAKGVAHQWTPEEARHYAPQGGKKVSQDRAHMAAIGRTGAESRKARKARIAEKKQKDEIIKMWMSGRAAELATGHVAEVWENSTIGVLGEDDGNAYP